MPLSRGTPPDWQARSTWVGLNDTAFVSRWSAFADSGGLGATCPKVGIGFFYYPSLGRSLRGAVARAPIARGEKLCVMPVQAMLSELTVGNSTLRPLMDAAEVPEPPPSADNPVLSRLGFGRKRAKQRAVDRRAYIVLYVLRETSRARSPMMPYLSVLLTHDVSGVPMTWEPSSPRLRSASPYARALASSSRTSALRAYETVVPSALANFAPLLSEGLDCATRPRATARAECSRRELERHYSRTAFVRVFAILAARDWVLPMYGTSRAFLVPVVDMFNFGQVGIRAHFDDARHAFVATASQPIAKGTELLFFYGALCREAWVNLYGFSPTEARPCQAAASKGTSKGKVASANSRAPWKASSLFQKKAP